MAKAPRELVFPRQSRLLRSSDFQTVFRQGQKRTRAGFSIRYQTSPTGFPRLGVAFLKKKLNELSIETS